MAVQLTQTDYGYVARFYAMASPCDCLIETENEESAKQIAQLAANEAWRIEHKYSRYKSNNYFAHINSSNGNPVAIDDETFQLLTFAAQCYQVSEGMFDLTSGVLRNVWHFKQASRFPDKQDIEKLLPFIGWENISFTKDSITIPPHMEIDFGGIGKEYAVDRAANIIAEAYPATSVVVNFGGDLRVTSAPKSRPQWNIGVDSQLPGIERSIFISVGAVCTSGSTERYIIHNGKRYSHILNPKTGYPVQDSPKTVTIIADHCLQAGMMATLAMLQGSQAESFLTDQNVKYFCQW